MKATFRLKTWAGPLTIGAFVVMAATGILMFFHWSSGGVKLAHEWLGWLMVIGGIAHLMVNWTPFVAYLRKPSAVTILAIVVVLGALPLLSGGPPGRPPVMHVSRALEESSLKLVAQVAKRNVQSVTDELKGRGIQIRDENQTILEIASDNGTRSMEILTWILGSVAQPRSLRPS